LVSQAESGPLRKLVSRPRRRRRWKTIALGCAAVALTVLVVWLLRLPLLHQVIAVGAVVLLTYLMALVRFSHR
jgi:amino acid permease